MKPVTRKMLAASLAVVLAALPALSQAQGRHGGGWHGGGHGWGGWGWGPAFGVALGVDLALMNSSRYYGPAYYDYGYAYPRTVVVEAPPQVVYERAPAPVSSSRAADPIFYPRQNQSPAQTEADIRDCNAWATSQPRAMADASVFHRATAACMDGRGYTVR